MAFGHVAQRTAVARALAIVATGLLVSGFIQLERLAIPDAELTDPAWARHDPDSSQRVDHSAWDRFLAAYVTTDAVGVNRVAYGDVSPTDRQALDTYLEQLSATPVHRLARPEQLAFWVNLYNARTVALVLDHHPIESIRDIKFGLFSIGPWNEPLLEVAGRRLSLNDIEHGIIRPIWADERVHFVLNCAATGCPNLGAHAYTGPGIDTSLDAAARAYVNDPRGVRFDSRERLIVSKIFAWFEEDFGGSTATVLSFLRRYAEPDLAERLQGQSEIDDYTYDWSLNDAAAASADPASG